MLSKMNLIYLFLTFFFSSESTELQDNWQKFILQAEHTKVIELALETRGSFLKPLEIFPYYLLDFTSESLNLASLKALKHFDLDENYYLEFLQGDEKALNLPNLVIKGENYQHKLQVILKWFKSPYDFLAELSALEKLSKLNLKYAKSIFPLAMGKALHKGVSFYLLIETVASGKTLLASLKQAINKPSKITSFIKALKAQAKALAELHSANCLIENSSSELDFNFQELEELEKSLIYLEIPFPSILLEKIREIMNHYKLTTHPYRYQMGDPSWGNFFYAKEQATLTMIDLNSLHFTINQLGFPKQPFLKDYSAVREQIWSLEDYFPNIKEQNLFQIFQNAYIKSFTHLIPTDLELKYNLINSLLKILQKKIKDPYFSIQKSSLLAIIDKLQCVLIP